MTTKATRDLIDLSTRPVLSCDINGGTIDGTTIGATTPSTGAFTNLTAANITATTNLNVSAATITGTVRAYYADLAENYLADKIYPAGTVLKIGGSYDVTAVTDEFDVDVFGVVSSQPSFVLNSGEQIGGRFDMPIALVGRIPCRVIGPVTKGQRLVTSRTPGVAMGFVPKFIGRAAVKEWNLNEFGVTPFFARSLVNDPRTEERLVEVAVVTMK